MYPMPENGRERARVSPHAGGDGMSVGVRRREVWEDEETVLVDAARVALPACLAAAAPWEAVAERGCGRVLIA